MTHRYRHRTQRKTGSKSHLIPPGCRPSIGHEINWPGSLPPCLPRFSNSRQPASRTRSLCTNKFHIIFMSISSALRTASRANGSNPRHPLTLCSPPANPVTRQHHHRQYYTHPTHAPPIFPPPPLQFV
ncbi:hypothetical protein V8C44DRAFT_141105 [Trichoderma aethiopicum]